MRAIHSFVKKANHILETKRRKRDKPWSLPNDGDLWDMFAEITEWKGVQNTTIVWSKGHAKEQDIESGRTTANGKHGNDLADKAAGEAHKIHEETLCALDALAHRQKKYTEKYIEVLKMLAMVAANSRIGRGASPA